MKAARIHAYGHSDQIHVEDISQPSPGPDEVLIKIRAAGINPIDWKIREGFMARATPRAFPFTLGQDFCGEVLALGTDVKNVEAGDEVYGFANGAYAEFAVVPPKLIASKPRTVDDATAAALPTPGSTALQVVVKVVAPHRGQTVLIHGAAGGVGSIATQLCVARGAHVIATASSGDAEYLMELGVTQVIDYRSERFEDRVRDVDAVIDLVGHDTLTRSLSVIRSGGLLVTTVGPLDLTRAASRGIRGVQFVMQKNREDLEELAALVDEGIVRPRPTHVLPLAAAREAQDRNQVGHESGLVLDAR